ncbi:hypothetical protein EV681_1405 [Advenella incenata]|jgi:hypothetical protein|uniref:Uncharacterized protein n=1 Tax=Advenella incenata TaxID=267800 RepID=A0A4Q7VTA7_9BURK|nr:hypothetical protein EV681_1405 [Advenella incenata]
MKYPFMLTPDGPGFMVTKVDTIDQAFKTLGKSLAFHVV